MKANTKRIGLKKRFTKGPILAIIGWLMVIMILYVDLMTGDRYRLTILYQLAVIFFAYYVNFWYALLVAFICSILRPFSLHMEGHFYPSIDVPMINSIVRFVMYSITVFITARLRISDQALKELEIKLHHDQGSQGSAL